jgi:uncharacterized protein YndB with AHSA1/START domain
MREVGRTRDAGWEIGVSKTVDGPIVAVWDLITSPGGIAIWLGHGVTLAKGEPYETTAGTHGETRSFHELDRIRLTWWPSGWSHDTTLQLTVRSAGERRTRIGIHQERLADAAERERQRQHWQGVINALADACRGAPA